MTSSSDDRGPGMGGSDSAYLDGVSNLPTPARLTVGIVSAGRVGIALGVALEQVPDMSSAPSWPGRMPSRRRAADRLPESEILTIDGVVARSELLVLAVPDAELDGVVAEIAGSGAMRPNTLVVHTAGAKGIGVLAPLTDLGALPMAIHPAMTFVGTDDDIARLRHACFGVTAADEVGFAIAQALVLEMGGEPVRIADADRVLYHAALGGRRQRSSRSSPTPSRRSTPPSTARTATSRSATPRPSTRGTRLAERILAPLVTASLQNVLELGPRALTGPVARGDVAAVADHLAALRRLPEGPAGVGIAEAYRVLARRTTAYTDAPADLIDVLETS